MVASRAEERVGKTDEMWVDEKVGHWAVKLVA
jgi:hypothetical protein